MMPNADRDLSQRLAATTLVLSDVDGVLTDGGMYYGETGEELKKFSVRDGVGFLLLRQAGILCGLMTGEYRELLKRRAQKIKLDLLFMGIRDKLARLRQFARENNFDIAGITYVGDDLNDVELLGNVGAFLAPADANPLIRARADLVLDTPGGTGVIREVAARILGARGDLESTVQAWRDATRVPPEHVDGAFFDFRDLRSL